MKLNSLSYKENPNSKFEWEIVKFSLENIGLFVAQNATGKTRTINVINSFASILSNKTVYKNCHFKGTFEDDEHKTFVYEVSFNNEGVEKETLSIDDKHLITRTAEGTAEIWFEELSKMVKTRIPVTDLASSRQDDIQHPFLQELVSWGKNTILYLFGSDMGKHAFSLIENSTESTQRELNHKAIDAVVAMYYRGLDRFGNEFKQQIISDMSSINYSIEDILISEVHGGFNLPVSNKGGTVKCLAIKEKGISQPLPQHSLSQGMFRALSLIIHLNYIQSKKLKGCILIDDIGEGLDFERSTKLIKLLINKAENSFSQLFMTTNDRFVMNEVPLKYWNIIIRDGHTCSILNNLNSKKIFEEFQFTGLNNFDFLSMEFYKQDSIL